MTPALFLFLWPTRPWIWRGGRALAALFLLLTATLLPACKRHLAASDGGQGATRGADGGARRVATEAAAPDPWPEAGGAPDAGGVLTVRLRAEPPHLNLLIQPDHSTSRITLYQVFETLLEESPRDYGLVPGLAATYALSPDRRTVTLGLRAGARWHDGRPVTSADVKWTLDTVLDPTSPATTLRANLAHLRRVEAPQPDVVVLRYSQPDYFALRALAGVPILPRHVYGTGELGRHPANRLPVGSGPYRVASWTAGREIVLERAPTYVPPAGAPPSRLATLRYLLVREDAVAALMVRRGELDVDERAGNDEWLAAWDDEALRARAWRFLAYPPGYAFRVYNTRVAPLRDRRVRRALTLLTDRATSLREVHRGLHRAVDSPYPAESGCAAPGPAFAPAEAAALLREAGYGPGQRPLRLSWLIPASSKTLVPEARIFAADARRVGVEVTLETVDWPTFQSRLRAGQFELAALAWFTSVDDDLYATFHSSQSKDGLNYGAFNHPALDRLLEAARTEFAPAARQTLCRQISQILQNEQIYTFLYQLASPAFVSKRVRGLFPSAMGLSLRHLWLAP